MHENWLLGLHWNNERTNERTGKMAAAASSASSRSQTGKTNEENGVSEASLSATTETANIARAPQISATASGILHTSPQRNLRDSGNTVVTGSSNGTGAAASSTATARSSASGRKRPADTDYLDQMHRCKRLLKNLKLAHDNRAQTRFLEQGLRSTTISSPTRASSSAASGRPKRRRDESVDLALLDSNSSASASSSSTSHDDHGNNLCRLFYDVLLPKAKQARRHFNGYNGLEAVGTDETSNGQSSNGLLENFEESTTQEEENGSHTENQAENETETEENDHNNPPLQNPSGPENPPTEPSDPENQLCVVLPARSSRSSFRSTMLQALQDAASGTEEVWLRIGKLLDNHTLLVDESPRLRYGLPGGFNAHQTAEERERTTDQGALPEVLASSLNALCQRRDGGNQTAIVPYNRAKLHWEPKGGLWLDVRALLSVSWNYLEEILGIPMSELREYIVYRAPDMYEPPEAEDRTLNTADIQTPRIEVVDDDGDDAQNFDDGNVSEDMEDSDMALDAS